MNKSYDPWDSIELTTEQIKNNYDKSDRKDPWQELEFKESWGKSILRSLYQIPSGIAQAVTYPLDLIHMIGVADASDPEEIDRLKIISEREGIPFDEEKYFSALEQASSMFPTQGNIETLIEEQTGAPLTPKTKLQKGLKLAATAGSFAPGNLVQKGAAAITAPTISTGLQLAGAPESISELAGLAVSPIAAMKTPSISISKAKKPSGLPIRRFESLEKTTEISPSRLKTINQKIENDFKVISKELIKDSPIEKTYSSLKEDLSFKEKVGEKFRDVESLAENIPGKFKSEEIKTSLTNSYRKQESKGISPSEYEKDYVKFMKSFIQETPNQEISAKNLVEQYRKNNKSLSEIYDPSHSRAYNRAKKDALIDYNKSIADTIEKKYPDSEFSDLFKFTNKRWTEIKDSEFIDKFIDDMFKGKVSFEKGKKFYTPGFKDTFQRALGENYSKFETLMGDLMSSERAHSFLKIAEGKGFESLAKTGITYLLHPKLAAGKVGFEYAKSMYQTLLDKPRLAVTWDEGIKALKKGEYSTAQKNFQILDAELTPKQKAFKKYKEKITQSDQKPNK